MNLRIMITTGVLIIMLVLGAVVKDDSDNKSGLTESSYAATLFSTQDARYIGVAACVMCHRTEQQGRQEALWRESAHARAFETLKSERSVQIGKDMGIKKPPHEAPECLVCHVTGWDLPPERMDARFKIEDGVQCETCHGAGSEYRAIHARDVEAGRERGLIVASGDPTLCLSCHNENSPTYKGFDFENYMARIAHPIPQ